MDSRHVIGTLNRLIATCRDGRRGFEAAAEGVADPRLRRLFQRLSIERSRFTDELQAEVVRLGGQPGQAGTIRGALHRGWIRVSGAAGSASVFDILKECHFGERTCLAHYEDALKTRLPEGIEALVARQCARVAEVEELVRDLSR